MFDKIIIDNVEYICLGTLYIDNKTIYQVYKEDEEYSIYIEEIEGKYFKINNKQILNKIHDFVTPKTDVQIERNK